MIWCVEGKLELFICSTCKERWVGQSGEPKTQEWLAAHDKPHLKDVPIVIGGSAHNGIAPGSPPLGFGRE